MKASGRRRAAITMVVMAIALAGWVTCATSQTVRYPGLGEMRQYTRADLGMRVSFPAQWELERGQGRNEVWTAFGELRGVKAGCFVRVSEVEGLRLSKPEDFFPRTSEADFVRMTSMAMPDIKVHRYDMAYLSGRSARQAIYSGTDAGVKTGTVSYQTLDGDRIVTVACFSEARTFQMLYNDFEAVMGSFSFVGRQAPSR